MFLVNEDEQDDLKVQQSGDPKGPSALRRSEKEGGRRPPESSRDGKFLKCELGKIMGLFL